MLKILIAAAAGAMLWAGSAQAATIVQTAMADSGGGSSNPAIFTGFSSALGALTAVDLTIVSNNEFSPRIAYGGVDIDPTETPIIVPYSVGGELKISAGSTDIYSADLPTITGNYILDTYYTIASFRIPYNSETSLDSSLFYLFSGDDSIYLRASYLSDYHFSFPTDASAFDIISETATKLTLTYTYAASAVPEPATWGLMIVGLGLIGSLMRSRRQTAIPVA